MAVATIPGYPIKVGAKTLACHPTGHAGPNPYVPMTTGPLAGGDTLYASEFGMKYFEHVDGGLTSDGLYRVEAVSPVAGPVVSVPLRWTVMATGAQAAAIDLSGSKISLHAIGL